MRSTGRSRSPLGLRSLEFSAAPSRSRRSGFSATAMLPPLDGENGQGGRVFLLLSLFSDLSFSFSSSEFLAYGKKTTPAYPQTPSVGGPHIPQEKKKMRALSPGHQALSSA